VPLHAYGLDALYLARSAAVAQFIVDAGGVAVLLAVLATPFWQAHAAPPPLKQDIVCTATRVLRFVATARRGAVPLAVRAGLRTMRRTSYGYLGMFQTALELRDAADAAAMEALLEYMREV
jgi:hypothetical protein